MRSCVVFLAYLIERYQTKIQLDGINLVRQSNKIKHLFCCKFDYETNQTSLTKSNAIEPDLV